MGGAPPAGGAANPMAGMMNDPAAMQAAMQMMGGMGGRGARSLRARAAQVAWVAWAPRATERARVQGQAWGAWVAVASIPTWCPHVKCAAK